MISEPTRPDVLRIGGMDIQVKVDPAMPSDRIELRDGTKLLCTALFPIGLDFGEANIQEAHDKATGTP